MKKIIIGVLLVTGLFAAEDITITAGVDRNVVETNDQETLTSRVTWKSGFPVRVLRLFGFLR